MAALWKSCRCKGSYTRILSPAEVVLRSNGVFDEEKLQSGPSCSPDRPLAYKFDFIEIFSGASAVTAAMAARGMICGPISISVEYDLSLSHVMEWIT